MAGSTMMDTDTRGTVDAGKERSVSIASQAVVEAPRGANRTRLIVTTSLATVLVLAALGGLAYSNKALFTATSTVEQAGTAETAAANAGEQQAAAVESSEEDDPDLATTAAAEPQPASEPAPEPTEQASNPPTPAALTQLAEAASPPVEAAPVPRLVPIPAPRPPEFRRNASQQAVRRAERPARQAAAPAAPVEDTRSFFDRLFGVQSEPTPALAYTALDTRPSVQQRPAEAVLAKPLAPAPIEPPAPAMTPRAGGGTAVYDISARIVTMPNGERLEAHSGIGETMDDPRYAHVRMRGPTPPGTYDLTERESPFHGVRALRMHPVGGTAAVHGRNGLLTHSYLRGPSGASSGCVSFRDYNRFLQAYLRGEVARIVVVPGKGAPQDPVGTFVSRLFGGA